MADTKVKSKSAIKLEPAVARRRAKVDEFVGPQDAKRAWTDAPIGIAFSGGGIRSATISLGITQALARRGRLYAFDYMSTVSGGGYFGSFLRSLFVPESLRGVPGKASAKDIEKAFHFADQVLTDPPNATTIGDYKHPIRSLRESGRYLAPGGASDFAYAISLIGRNWLAMLYVFALATAALFIVVQFVLIAAAYLGGLVEPYGLNVGRGDAYFGVPPVQFEEMTGSPAFIPAAFLGIMSLGVGAAYWLTESMSYTPEVEDQSKKKFFAVWFVTFLAFLFGLGLYLRRIDIFGLGEAVVQMSLLASLYFRAGLLILTLALLFSIVVFLIGIKDRNATPGMRRRLTKSLTIINIFATACVAIGVIDTLAIGIRDGTFGWGVGDGPGPLTALILYPSIAYLIKKAPEWASGVDNALIKKLTSNIALVALIIGVLMFGMLAVGIDVIVHMALWTGPAWASQPFDGTWTIFVITISVLFLMTGISGGFINLASLHPLYSSRLTRAYIGATNPHRLRSSKGLTDGDEKDHIASDIYQQTDLPIACHLINLTLNETKSENKIVERDRKGRRFIVGPEGIAVDGTAIDYGWNGNAELLSVGQLCAISGAAASSGMGRRTTLGTAMALTYANVRLGYWWKKGDEPEVSKPAMTKTYLAALKDWLWHYRWGLIGTYIYLFNEMTAHYTQAHPRLYLTDGGHSENSGALALLERGCRFILVADNGQDQNFSFSDLEIFIRTARTDLGIEVCVADPPATRAYVGRGNTKPFLNMAQNWRQAALAADGPGIALLLTAAAIDVANPDVTHIVWMKPRVFDDMPSDIATYAGENKPFPHQSTSDQFFDEAQWESYRRLGYEMARHLFATPGQMKDVPVIGGRV